MHKTFAFLGIKGTLICWLIISYCLSATVPASFRSENTLIEFCQVSILIYCLVVHYISGRGNRKNSPNRLSFFSRLILFSFLLVEEMSYITKNFGDFSNFNNQGEANIHNANFIHSAIANITLPNLSYSFSITIYTLSTCLALLLLGYGGYFASVKNKSIFLDKSLSVFVWLFPLDVIFYSLNTKILGSTILPVMHPEFLELFIYIILAIDVFLKTKKPKGA